MFGLGPLEISLIAVATLLIFGRRLPTIAGSVGKSIISFRKGLQEAEAPDNAPHALDQEQKPSQISNNN